MAYKTSFNKHLLFKLVLIKRSKEILFGFSNLFLLSRFEYKTNNSSEPKSHPVLEDVQISPLSTLSAKMEALYLLLLSKNCIFWKCWSSFFVYLHFLFLTNFWNFFQLVRWVLYYSFHRSWSSFSSCACACWP